MLKRAAKALARRAAGTLGYGLVPVPTVKPSGIFRRLLRGPSEEHPTVRSVKEHLENAVTPATLPPLGARWGAYAMRLSSRLRELSTPEEVVLLGQMPEAGVETHFRSPELIGHCYGTDLELLADLPPDLYKAFSSFRAPQIVHDVFTVQYQGRALDFVTLCAARIILGILHLLDRDLPKTVCDIGGGTGKFAFSWLTNSAHRPDLVVIVDLPETLVYSETLLRTELGDDRVQYVTSPTSQLLRSGAILCPIAHVSALKGISFDLVTNFFSMQEMTDAWVD